jgi:hypothetical protein
MVPDQFVLWVELHLGEWHHPYDDPKTGELITDCPKCGAKKRLYLNPLKKMYNCQKCGGGLLMNFLSDYGLTRKQAWDLLKDDVEDSVGDFDLIGTGLPRIVQSEPEIEDPKDFVKDFVPLRDSYAESSRVELQRRGFDVDWAVNNYGVMHGLFGKFADRLILPVFQDGEFVYFQARTLRGHPAKYLNPRGPKGRFVFNYDGAKAWAPGRTLFICEGAFNAMSAGVDCCRSFRQDVVACAGGVAASTGVGRV